MGTLSTSNLKNVSVYRDSNIDLVRGDVMEVSLSGDNGYVSSKLDLGSLKDWIIGEGVSPHRPFDIFYRAIKETPTEYNIVNGVKELGNLYSAWPLFIDSSSIGTELDINKTAPNWLGKWFGTMASKASEIYPDLWADLSTLTNNFTSTSAVLFNLVNSSDANSIAASLYMQEYNTQGYTGRFLIDTNGYVALPILNNSFMRTVSVTGSSTGTSELDDFKSHGHIATRYGAQGEYTPGVDYGDGVGPMVGGYSSGLSGGSETRPKNVRYCPYMQVSNSFAKDSILDVASAVSGMVFPDFASSTETGTFATSALSTKMISPLTLDGGFRATGNQLLATNGYQKLPGGIIMQWGRNMSRTPFSYPLAFSNVKCVCIGIHVGALKITVIEDSTYIDNITQTNFLDNHSSAVLVHWYAIGY